MKRTSRIFVATAGILLVGTIAACDDDLIDDATFRLWDGDKLASWTLEQGSVRKAPTWHPNDYGVELLDTPTVISQVSKSSSRPTCIAFTTMADVDASAQVWLGVDFNADGTIDVEQPIAATDFHVSENLIKAPLNYGAIRFVISKKGTGHAVLAEIRAVSDTRCTGSPLELHDQALGTACGSDDQCASTLCCSGICAECCKADATCGLGTCKQTAVSIPPGAWAPAAILQCNPGAHNRASGMACLFDADCTSGTCQNAELTSISNLVPDAGPACTPSVDDPSCPWVLQRQGQCR
ncbi:hypothetical protein AKJ09_03934 [Labilithrix luteola]|uniref:Uncharacterized protein n=1 Tax=Labilithrix luteola TaxID=1391654 RepID=A0A0K1PUR6_9BACT|nr:hypothetical protein [Labilithrix luteola]AKU97270.1 hypothetical protein AKJ09_03934 [Labilithrix luteola]